MGVALLFTGACRSGKSALAQRWAEAAAPCRAYIATAPAPQGDDPEMTARIARHQAARGPGWLTVELAVAPTADAAGVSNDAGIASLLAHEPLLLALQATRHAAPVAVVDCTTLWMSGLMAAGWSDRAILDALDQLLSALPALALDVAFVHNETGWGMVPEHPLSRRFRDVSGEVGQRLACHCTSAVLAVCGLPVPVKGALPGGLG